MDAVEPAVLLAPESRPQPLTILLSAYACEPDKGSEPGVGWRWALNLAAAGHRVWVITRENNRAAIERALAAQSAPHPRFAYYDLPPWARRWKKGGRGVYLYYLLWQAGAFGIARALCREQCFDLVHHITFGVFRQPSFMAFLGLPFVFGPVGGGESAPRALRRGFPLRGRLADLARDLANALVRIDPLMHAVFRRSAIILCKTRETLERIPSRYLDKCRLQLEIGSEAAAQVPQEPAGGGLRVLFVGRLVYWKGLHLGLAAFARLLQTRPGARMTVVGSGPQRRSLERLAQRLGIGHALEWRAWLPRSEVLRLYPRHDAFLFPSLHDSSGNVVLEALSCGLPVVCLDLGGPGLLVDDSCGLRIAGGDEGAVIDGLGRALERLADDGALRRCLAEGALVRAGREFSWSSQTERMSRIYASVAGGCGGRTAPWAGLASS